MSYLDTLGFSDNLQILLTWDIETSLLTTWKYFKRNWTDFFYPSSDDLTIIGEHRTWALLFHHSNAIYYSTNDIDQQEYTHLLKECLSNNFESLNLKTKPHDDNSIDFEIESPSKELKLWISSMNREISIGFEDKNGISDWHTHMSLFGANFPNEQLTLMTELVNHILTGNEKIAHSSVHGFYLTDDYENELKNKIEKEEIYLKEWNEL